MENGRGKTISIWWLIGLLVLILFLWALSGILLHGDVQNRGTFGDMFGAINALFSGCAFATLIFTVWMQREELSLQRRELELTRMEMSGQKEQLEFQAKTMKLQQFETIFFSLLRTQQEIINATDLVGAGIVTKGRDCYKVFYKRFKEPWDKNYRVQRPMDGIRNAYAEFYRQYEPEVGHYFRHLYHLIKFIKNSDVSDPKQYTNLVRAQLSSYELLLLFYNCLYDTGRDKFKPLVEEFSLLKNLPRHELLSPDHVNFYESSAFTGTAPPIAIKG